MESLLKGGNYSEPKKRTILYNRCIQTDSNYLYKRHLYLSNSMFCQGFKRKQEPVVHFVLEHGIEEIFLRRVWEEHLKPWSLA